MVMVGASVRRSWGWSGSTEAWPVPQLALDEEADRRDSINLGLALANWMVLLVMMFLLLLASTLPRGSYVLDGVSGVTCSGTSCPTAAPGR
jgi:hypothetical protein